MSHEATRLAWLTKEPQHGARLVLLALADHHNATTNECYPSVARLAETTLLERKAVIRGLAELERLGVIGTERKNGCRSQYNLHFLDQPQNGTGDKMGPATKEDSTSPKMGRDRSQNGTRNRERTGKEPGKVLIGEPAECQPNTPAAGSQEEPVSTQPPPGKPSPSPEYPPDAPEPTSATNTPTAKENPATATRNLTAEPLDHHFDAFVREYPRKVRSDKHATIQKTWLRMVTTPEIGTAILADVRFRKTTENWKRNSGQYVPGAGKYLADRKWLEPAAIIERLTHELDRHPGNHDSIHHKPAASAEIVADFKNKRTQLRQLQGGQS
jgi:hypothetical protein